jgi:phospholipid/cholesterol/gamma-HCH transport system substrate-binding protein
MVTEFRTRERIVGLFLVITLFILIGAIVFIAQGKNWFKKHERYHTYYKEGYNLSPGSKVTLYQTKIGKVVKVTLTEDNRVRVDLKILAEYASRIREDTVATVRSPTIIGSEYIEIIPGTAQKVISPGETIPSKEKKALADYMEEFKVEEKIEILTGIVANIKEITDGLKDPDGGLFGSLNNIKEITESLKNPEGPLFASLDNIRHTTASLKDPKEGLFKALNDLSSIVEQIKRGEGSAGKLLVSDDLYIKIEEEIQKVDAVLNNIETTTARMPAIVDEVENRLKEIKGPLKQLEHTLEGTPEIIGTVQRELDEINDIIEGIKENFLIKKYLPPEPEEKALSVEGRGE